MNHLELGANLPLNLTALIRSLPSESIFSARRGAGPPVARWTKGASMREGPRRRTQNMSAFPEESEKFGFPFSQRGLGYARSGWIVGSSGPPTDVCRSGSDERS